jgi:glutaredoxin
MLFKMNTIDVYGRDNCPYCVKVKALLEARGHAFTYHDIEKSGQALEDFNRRTNGAKTVPQVIVGSTLVGGYTETLASITRSQFQKLVGGSKAND